MKNMCKKNFMMIFCLTMLITIFGTNTIFVYSYGEKGNSALSVSKQVVPKTIQYDAKGIFKFAHNAIFYIKVYREDGTLKDVGTGFLISKDSKALTAYHVIEGAERIEAVFDDGRVINNLTVLSSNKDSDVAFLKLNMSECSFLSLADNKLEYGEKTFAIGYPIKNTPIITEGIVNAPKALVNGRNRVLTSAQFESGMSGGPLFNDEGKVIGVISGSFRTMNNINIAVGTEDINKIIKDEQQIKK
jgi:serine protease Do